MSTGDKHHAAPAGVSARTIEKYMHNPEVMDRVFKFQELNREFDLPYLAGYNVAGTVIYIDRHLPQNLTGQLDGRKYTFDPTPFLRTHESFEKALIDSLHFDYAPAHQVATKVEHRQVLQAGIPISVYDGPKSVLERYIKADEHEKLVKIPPDLDMTPYHTDKRLFNCMLEKMGANKGKAKKETVDYSKGMTSAHCGPVQKWRASCECEHYIVHNQCQRVAGFISPEYWCKLHEPIDE